MSKPPTIVLIGGSVRAAASDLQETSLSVVAVDRFGDRDLAELCDHWVAFDDQHQWLDRVIHQSPAIWIPVGGFEWTLKVSRALESLPSVRVAYPPPEQMEPLRSPRWLKAAAERCRLGFPEILDVSSLTQTAKASIHGAQEHWFVKSIHSGGGYGIKRWHGGRVLPDQYIQRFVNGTSVGVNFLIPPPGRSAPNFLGAFRGLVSDNDESQPFLYGGSSGPVALPVETLSAIQDFAGYLQSELGIRGLVNIDLVITDKRAYLLEVNPRYSASMELIDCPHFLNGPRTRPSLLVQHLQCYFDDDWMTAARNADKQADVPKSPLLGNHSACKLIVYSPKTWLASQLEQVWQRLQRDQLSRILPTGRIELADIPSCREALVADAPMFTVLTTACENETAAERLARQTAAEWLTVD